MLTTDPELSDTLAELSRREPIFHRPELGTTMADFEAMTVSNFWEVGASGCRYSRAAVLETLEKRYAVSAARPSRRQWNSLQGWRIQKPVAGRDSQLSPRSW